MNHNATAAPAQEAETVVEVITRTVSVVLVTTLTVRTFIGRWQVIRTKLVSLQASLQSLSTSPHWSQNQLLHILLPSLLATLQRLHSLSSQCNSSPPLSGKLHFQSDLDIASSSLSSLLHDLDLLLRSGVLHLSNAIVLSHPGPDSDQDDRVFFVKDLFTRLQIGGVDFKKQALHSLLQVLDEDFNSASLVAKEGNVGYLIGLLDYSNHPLVRELAVTAVSTIATACDQSRKIMFEEGGLGPLLRVLETGSMPLKEKAAAAIEAITSDPDNGWAVSAYSGVSVLVEACRSGSLLTQSHAVGAIRNVAATVEDVKVSLAEEGAVPVLIQILVSGNESAREKAANCVAILASSGEFFRSLIIQEKGLQRLMQLVQGTSSFKAVEHSLHAISYLSIFDSVSRFVSASTGFVMVVGELIKQGNVVIQQSAASLLASLPISDGNKRAISSSMGALVKLMECPKPAGLQEAAVGALASLLTVRTNRKELVRDEKSVMKLVQMLDPKYEAVSKNYPVAVVNSLLSGGSAGCRKRLLAAGAHLHLQQLTEMEVAGANKALRRLSGHGLKSIFFSRTWRD